MRVNRMSPEAAGQPRLTVMQSLSGISATDGTFERVEGAFSIVAEALSVLKFGGSA